MGFGRACAPVRCAHPSFWALCHDQRGAARPPPIAASLRAARGIYFSTAWAKLRPTELRCTLVSNAAPSWALLYPAKLQYAAFKWAMLHSIWASLHPKHHATPSELRCTLWAKLQPSELRWTLLSYGDPTELCLTLNELWGTLEKYNVPRTSQLRWSLWQNNGN